MTPIEIIEFAKKSPGALEQLIASFGYQCYLDAVNDLTRYFTECAVCSIPEKGVTAILISGHYLKDWQSGDRCKWKAQLPKREKPNLKFSEEVGYVSNCCDAKMADPNTSDICPKCKEHCLPVVEGIDELV